MKIIQGSIRYPVTTAVGVILVVLFGVIALFRLPVQLTPDVEDPVITVTTFWPGASPEEVEQEIIQEQEEQLKSVEGLVELESTSRDSYGEIVLTFLVGTDIDGALLRVSNRLEQVPTYPEDADKPVIRTVDPNANAIAWFVFKALDENGYDGDIWALHDFIDDYVKPEFERVPGVAVSNFFGGREREMQVSIDPAQLAQRQVTVGQVAAALERENRNFSGGDFDEGKRRYIVRTVGQYRSAEDIENIVVAVRSGVPVYLRDVGHAELGFRKADASVFHMGNQIIAVNVSNEPGTNVLDVMTGVKVALKRLNEQRLAPLGLEMFLVYDQTEYIASAIDLVQQSLMIGGVLAILSLLLYMRSGSSTLVIAVAIPISVIGTFLVMNALGRTLNVVSLAGMAFAVGMVVDNSIVVLENIYRHRQLGKSRFDAAHDGATEVWGAVLASTLTTIAVFVPIVFMQDEVGQLFGDIALAISCAVALSLVVAITVIPSLSSKILGWSSKDDSSRGFKNLWGGAAAAQALTEWIGNLVHRMTGSTVARVVVVVSFTIVAIGGSWLLVPPAEYLPLGNQNFLFGLLLPPPGYSLNEVIGLQDVIMDDLVPMWEHPAGSPEAEAQPGGGIANYFFVALNRMAFMGAVSNDPLRVRELPPRFMAVNRKLPGSIFVMQQASLFEGGRGEGRNIDIEITGPDLDELISRGLEVFQQVMPKIPGSQAQPIPSLDLGNPEVQVRTDRRRAAELGLSNRELGYSVSVLVDGAKASEFQFEGREIDIRLKADEPIGQRTHLLEQLPIATPDGSLVTLGSVADISVVNGPVEVLHVERERAVIIRVTPDEGTPLESAMATIESEILDPMREAGRIGGLYQVRLSGAAEKLDEAMAAVRWDLLLALVITYLLLSALFESFLYPFVIMFSVPLAALGGFAGLALINWYTDGAQHLDVLTMLGFVILIGTVVNNAILIVHQSLNHMRDEGMGPRDAIRESVRNRMRPIFMSVTTSVLGMTPLILFVGAGSELYRGLGSVVVGGLLVSTLFTLFLVPALFSLGLDVRAAGVRGLARLSGRKTPVPR